MTEYWVSQAKHYCKICKVWISGHKTNIRNHELTEGHQINQAKLLRDARRAERAREEEGRAIQDQLRRIETAAGKQYADDLIWFAARNEESSTPNEPNPPPGSSTTSNSSSVCPPKTSEGGQDTVFSSPPLPCSSSPTTRGGGTDYEYKGLTITLLPKNKRLKRLPHRMPPLEMGGWAALHEDLNPFGVGVLAGNVQPPPPPPVVPPLVPPPPPLPDRKETTTDQVNVTIIPTDHVTISPPLSCSLGNTLLRTSVDSGTMLTNLSSSSSSSCSSSLSFPLSSTSSQDTTGLAVGEWEEVTNPLQSAFRGDFVSSFSRNSLFGTKNDGKYKNRNTDRSTRENSGLSDSTAFALDLMEDIERRPILNATDLQPIEKPVYLQKHMQVK